jgi:hypothetical protein
MTRVTWKEAIEIARKNRDKLEEALAEEVRKDALNSSWSVDDNEGDYWDQVSCLETGD